MNINATAIIKIGWKCFVELAAFTYGLTMLFVSLLVFREYIYPVLEHLHWTLELIVIFIAAMAQVLITTIPYMVWLKIKRNLSQNQ